jgi:predicted phage baseplate assembly protein
MVGTRLTCTRQPEVGFVLERDQYLSDALVTDTMLDRDGESVSLSALIGRAGASIPLAPRLDRGSAVLVMRFDRPLMASGTPADAHVVLGFDVEPPPITVTGTPHRWGPLVFDYRVGTGTPVDADVVEDTTMALARTGVVRLRLPAIAGGGPSELRLKLDQGFFPVAPRLRRVALNVLPVVQHEPEAAAVLANGTGLPNQEVPLDTRDVVQSEQRPMPVIQVSEGGVTAEWEEVRDFQASTPQDRHYVRRPDRLVFGNGINGRRPSLGAQIRHGDFVRTRGIAGNLRAGLVWRVAGLPQGLEGYGTSIAAMSGGAGPWDMDDLLAAARDVATGRRALLTNEELRTAAIALPGFAVARAEVLARFDAALPERRIAGVRTLFVVPYRDPSLEPAAASPTYLDAVRAVLDDQRVLGERLMVRAPALELIDLVVSLTVDEGAQLLAVREAVEDRLRARLSDLRRRDDIDPWPLGRRLSCGEIEALVANVDGVAIVPSCRMARAGEPVGTADIAIARDGIAVAADIRIDARAGNGEA